MILWVLFLVSWEDTNSLGLQRARRGRRQQLVCWRCQKVASEFCQEKSLLTDQCWQCWQLQEKCRALLQHLGVRGGRPLHTNSAFWLGPQSSEFLLTHQSYKGMWVGRFSLWCSVLFLFFVLFFGGLGEAQELDSTKHFV